MRLIIKNLVFGGNYFAREDFVLYINHSGKYIEINFNMKIPFFPFNVIYHPPPPPPKKKKKKIKQMLTTSIIIFETTELAI